MINPNTENDIRELEEAFDILREKAKDVGVDLVWQEIKGTVFFMPKLLDNTT